MVLVECFFPKCDNLTLQLITSTGNGEWRGDECSMLLEARVFLGERWKTKLNEMKMKACDEIVRAVTKLKSNLERTLRGRNQRQQLLRLDEKF